MTGGKPATGDALRKSLRNLEGRSYREYKRLKGDYAFPEFRLRIDHVQGDPFAAPSRISVRLTQQVARFPAQWLTDYVGQTAIADYVTRQVAQVAQSIGTKRGSGRRGRIAIAAPSQAILRRTAVSINPDQLTVRLTVGLPAFGRRIAGQAAADLLCKDIPCLVEQCLKYEALNADEVKCHVRTLEDNEALRHQLRQKGLIAFVAENARLARRSGIDERPLIEGAEPFVLPEADTFLNDFQTNDHNTIELETPHSGRVKGLGIRAGVTLIVGGGYHGKSTLLRAIEQGIYAHVPGDGREQVVTDAATVKLRAEDGRSVAGVDISPVINQLPKGRSSQDFSTTNASGSTSQAAGLIEAVEAGAKVLLIDEDTAATNFMIRDRKMQSLIAKDKEPITPFVDKVRQLYDDYGISTILVMGSSGDYFAVADTVIAMEGYQPRIVTKQAKAIAGADSGIRQKEGGEQFGKITPRAILPGSLPAGKGDRSPKTKARKDSLVLGYEEINLRAVEQIVEAHQVRAIAQAMIYAQRYYLNETRPISELLDYVMADIERGGLEVLAEGDKALPGDWAMFRRFELAAAFNRLRTVKVRSLF
ncbi:MAG: ABC-ATPase domain-containing protein [Cyanobacteria bacterium J06573_11]